MATISFWAYSTGQHVSLKIKPKNIDFILIYGIMRYMINSFGNKPARDLFNGLYSKDVKQLPGDILKRTIRLLDLIEAANDLPDIAIYPGTKLKKLSGALNDFYSIRINDQWRIIFKYSQGNAEEVSIVDYH